MAVPSPMVKISVGAAVLAIATVGLLVYSMLQQASVTCEVCVEFKGNSQCRTALGATREEAQQTATSNACGFVAAGMADSISCGNKPPVRVTCDDEQAGAGPR